MTVLSEVKRNRGFRLPLAARGSGILWFGLAAVAAVVVFWQGFGSLLDAWQTPEYSYGPVIPLLSAYIFLRVMTSVPRTDRPVTDRWPGVAVVAVALLIGLLGNIVRIPDRYVTFQLAEVATPRSLFQKILGLIDDLRP